MNLTIKIKSYLNSGDTRGNKIKKNIIGSFFIKGCSILIQLLLVPLTLDYLSTEIYGIWLTISSILLWLGFFDIGFTLGLKNKLTEALALGDLKRGKTLVSTTYAIMIAIFIPLWIILELIVPHIDWSTFLNISPIYNEQIIQVMQVLVTCFCLQMIFNIIGTVLAAYQRVAISGAFPVIGNLISIIIIYILTKTTAPSLLNLAIAISYLPVIVLFISSIILFKNKLKDVSPSFKYFDFSHVKDIFNLGIKFFIIQIQMIVLYQATNILISNVSTPEDVTAYNIAYRYIGTALMIFMLILGPLWPAFTDAYTKKDYSWMKRTYHKMIKIYACIILLIILMVAFSPIIYQIWIGDSSIVPIMMSINVGVYIAIRSWDNLQVMLINGIGTIKLQSYVTLIGLILHIPLSLWLGKYMGALGVITSMIIINLIYSIFFTLQIHKIINCSAQGLWIK